MIQEQFNMLSKPDYALVMGLWSEDSLVADAANTTEHAQEAIHVGLCAIKHLAGIALKVHAKF